MMLYHMATVGVKGITEFTNSNERHDSQVYNEAFTNELLPIP